MPKTSRRRRRTCARGPEPSQPPNPANLREIRRQQSQSRLPEHSQPPAPRPLRLWNDVRRGQERPQRYDSCGNVGRGFQVNLVPTLFAPIRPGQSTLLERKCTLTGVFPNGKCTRQNKLNVSPCRMEECPPQYATHKGLVVTQQTKTCSSFFSYKPSSTRARRRIYFGR